MDTLYYELGSESECIVCQSNAIKFQQKKDENDLHFQNALTAFFLSDAGVTRKKQALEKFQSQ